MHPGNNRGNSGRRGMGGFGGNFGGFPDFPDPFAGLGLFGGGGGRSLVEEFFNRDPFDDPFFRRPFGGMFGPPTSLFGPPGGLLNPSSFFGRGAATGFLDEGPFGNSNNFLIEERPFNPPQPEGRRGPVIEELPDDDEAPVSESRNDQQEPIVEHPDDEATPGVIEHQPRNTTRLCQQSRSQPTHSAQTFSYQSSTISGTGGVYYSSSKRRVNSDGMMQEESYEKDGSAGIEKRSVARAIGDQMHAISRKRNADGREDTMETLRNLNEEEADKFNETWERRAGTSLPGRRSRSQSLENHYGESSGRSRLHLPSTEGYSHAWPGVRRP